MFLERKPARGFEGRPELILRSRVVAIGRAQHDVATERVFAEHEVERRFELLRR